MISAVTVAIIAALILLNAIYVAAEFGIVAVRRRAMEAQAAAGDHRAARVAHVLTDPQRQDRYIATAQLGITLASLGLGMYGEETLASELAAWLAGTGLPVWLTSHAVAGAIAIVALTYFHIVLGEMVPKAIALASAERVVRWLSPMILATQVLAYPLILILGGLGNALMRALGLSRQAYESARSHTPEELRYIVRESEECGLLQPEAADVLEELFAFSQLTAGEVMVPRVRMQGVEFGCLIRDLPDILHKAMHTRYPVYVGDLDHIVGTIHIKDVLRRARREQRMVQADIHPVPFLPETSTLDTVLAAMRRWRTQMAIVMDEHGGTAGLLTIEDLFEEVVGDIEDVATGRQPALHRGDDGALRAAGTVRVEEVGEALDLPLAHDEVDTVSGLVLALLDRPPKVGDVVTYAGVRLEVLAVEGHGVAACKITPPAQGSPAPDA